MRGTRQPTVKCVGTDRKQMSVLHSEGLRGLRGRPHISVSKRKIHKTTAGLFTDGGTLVEETLVVIVSRNLNDCKHRAVKEK